MQHCGWVAPPPFLAGFFSTFGTVPFASMQNAERRRRSGAGHLRKKAAISDRDSCVGGWPPFCFGPFPFPRLERCLLRAQEAQNADNCSITLKRQKKAADIVAPGHHCGRVIFCWHPQCDVAAGVLSSSHVWQPPPDGCNIPPTWDIRHPLAISNHQDFASQLPAQMALGPF